MMMTQASSYGRKGLEGLLIMILVLLSYVAILSLLTNAFPSGASLKQVVNGNAILAKLNFLNGHNNKPLMFSNGSYELNLGSESEYFAAIVEKINDVKAKGADSVAWSNAAKGLKLANQDAVQTFSRSSAVIRIDDDSYIDMGENSLIVINRMDNDQLLEEKRTRVVMLAGELRGEVTSSNNQTVQLEVATGKAQTKVVSAVREEHTRFSVKVNTNHSSTITVLEGGAEVTSGDQRVQLQRYSAVVIDENNDIQQPETIPAPVDIDKPLDGAEFFYKDFPGTVTFDWGQQSGAYEYQIVIAADRNFSTVLVDKIIEKSYFSHNNLKAGSYYWKVRGIKGMLQGDFSVSRRLKITQDNTPPILQLSLPEGTVSAGTFLINGTTEPKAVAFINNAPVKISATGAFAHAVELKKGVNIIVVEVLDRAGNVSYVSNNIKAR